MESSAAFYTRRNKQNKPESKPQKETKFTDRRTFTGQCYNCGRKGHKENECRSERKSKYQRKPKAKDNEKMGACIASACLMTKMTNEWIIDSAATHHFCNERKWFKNYTKVDSKVNLGEGESKAVGRGDIWLQMVNGDETSTLILKEVIHTPGMGKNLISARLMDIAGFKSRIEDQKFITYFPNDILAFEAKLTNNFYVLEAQILEQLPDEEPESYLTLLNEEEKWHTRLGHLNEKDLWYMHKHQMVQGLDKFNEELRTCDACKMSKSTAASHKKMPKIRSTEILELIHSDVWGPAPVKSMGGSRYYVSFVDDHSRYTHIYTMATKAEVFNYFKQYKAAVENSTGRKIKTIRTDNGLEFCSTQFEEFCITNGIKHERTNIFSPAMNGIAERINRTLVEMVRTFIEESHLPLSLWADLVRTAAYVKNRLKHSKLGKKVPMEVWTGVKPSVRHLRRIGCLVYVHIPKPHRRSKLNNRARKGVLIGYAIQTKGYRIWYPGEKKVSESKHVSFDEDVIGMVELTEMRNPRDHYSYTWPIYVDKETDVNTEGLEQIGQAVEEEEILIKEVPDIDQDEPQISEDNPQKIKTKGTIIIPEEPRLPDGWYKELRIRQSGKTAGKVDIYYKNPDGQWLRSTPEVKNYLKANNLTHDISLFDFSTKKIKTKIKTITPQVEEDTLESNNKEIFYEAQCSELKIPTTFEEAMNSPESKLWKAAMDDEIKTLTDRKVMKIVNKPAGKKMTGCRWVFVTKEDNHGNIIRYKARLVARGFNQIKGIDYNDTFAPIVNFSIIRLLIAIFIATFGWMHYHLDIKNAYLYGKLDTPVYMDLIPGYQDSDSTNYCLELTKSLYGLPQSAKLWFEELDRTFNNLGYSKLIGTNCVYHKFGKAIIMVYVDDLIILTKDSTTMNRIQEELTKIYEMKKIGPLRKILGVEVEETDQGIRLHQSHFIETIAKKFKITVENPVSLPIIPSIKLSRKDCPEKQEDKDSMKQYPYQSLIGSLLFLAQRTRPDILYAIITLSQFNSNPGFIHWQRLCQLTRYVVTTKNYGLNYVRTEESRLRLYSDSDWASDTDTRRSTCGYVCYFGSSPVSWRAFKQQSVTLSTMEAEYVALTDTIKELLWLNPIISELVKEFKINVSKPQVFCDNESAMYYARNTIENHRSKHIDIKYHFIRENLAKDMFNLKYVNTKSNVADIFTKALNKTSFYNCVNRLNLDSVK